MKLRWLHDAEIEAIKHYFIHGLAPAIQKQQFFNTKYIIKLHLHFTLLKQRVSIAFPFLGDEIREGGKLVQRSFLLWTLAWGIHTAGICDDTLGT